MFVELRMNFVARIDSALAPDAEQAIETCLDTLNALGAVVATSQTELPSLSLVLDPQRAWQEGLIRNRLTCQERYELSGREVEVLKLVAEGLSNTAIATQLHLSKHTVKSHLQRAGLKMGAGDRQRMVGLFNGTIMPDATPDHS